MVLKKNPVWCGPKTTDLISFPKGVVINHQKMKFKFCLFILNWVLGGQIQGVPCAYLAVVRSWVGVGSELGAELAGAELGAELCGTDLGAELGGAELGAELGTELGLLTCCRELPRTRNLIFLRLFRGFSATCRGHIGTSGSWVKQKVCSWLKVAGTQLVCRHCQIKGLEDSNLSQKHSSYLTILPNNMGGGAMGEDYFLGLNWSYPIKNSVRLVRLSIFIDFTRFINITRIKMVKFII